MVLTLLCAHLKPLSRIQHRVPGADLSAAFDPDLAYARVERTLLSTAFDFDLDVDREGRDIQSLRNSLKDVLRFWPRTKPRPILIISLASDSP
jgi:hypothetical protein